MAAHAEYRVLPVKVDVTSEPEVDALVSQMVTEFGRIDYAVNCAGVSTLFCSSASTYRPITFQPTSPQKGRVIAILDTYHLTGVFSRLIT